MNCEGRVLLCMLVSSAAGHHRVPRYEAPGLDYEWPDVGQPVPRSDPSGPSRGTGRPAETTLVSTKSQRFKSGHYRSRRGTARRRSGLPESVSDRVVLTDGGTRLRNSEIPSFLGTRNLASRSPKSCVNQIFAHYRIKCL